MPKAKHPANMQRPMTNAELRVLLRQTQRRLKTCLAYNAQWEEVGRKVETLAAENQRLRQECDYWKRLATGQAAQ